MTRTRLNLESLNDRIVPATVNLTTAGATGALNGAIFTQLAPNANGFDPTDTFLTLQERTLLGSLLTPEEGYNTNARPHQLDAIGGADETRALQLGEAPVIMQGGVAYREFLLTVRQPSFAPNINLDELRIFVGETPNVRGYNNTTNSLAGLPVAFNLDAGGNNTVRINDNLNRSGTADAAVLIPESAFTNVGATGDSFVYLYSSFGAAPLTSVLSGAEAWSVRELPDPPPPPGGGSSLSGKVTLDPNQMPGDENDLALVNVRIALLDVNFDEIAFTFTDTQGNYRFDNLVAGQYQIKADFEAGGFFYMDENNNQVVPELADGRDYVGTVDGVTNGDDGTDDGDVNILRFILLDDDDEGINYNFTSIRFDG